MRSHRDPRQRHRHATPCNPISRDAALKCPRATPSVPPQLLPARGVANTATRQHDVDLRHFLDISTAIPHPDGCKKWLRPPTVLQGLRQYITDLDARASSKRKHNELISPKRSAMLWRSSIATSICRSKALLRRDQHTDNRAATTRQRYNTSQRSWTQQELDPKCKHDTTRHMISQQVRGSTNRIAQEEHPARKSRAVQTIFFDKSQ